ncbi:MAG: ammonia channel protein [Dehalococcoidia bacterium]|nr:ammonia channel protein [Dehalococcoidia bacterium]|tara:strand:- start:144 stop:1349 length:1206 start_codon:yes stop_codon:yes gene_type:complete
MVGADIAWVMACSALVLLMTPGLAFFYGGLVGRKNAGGTIMHSLMAMGVVSIVWVLWGYSLAFAPGSTFVGGLDFFGLAGVSAEGNAIHGLTIPDQLMMIFQAMFAIITPALITGAFAERMKFSSYLIFITLWVTLVYAPVCHWVWGGGFLGDMGALDFAGGTVVHINSGIAALAAAIIFRKRLGFGSDAGTPHNVPMVVLGAGLLWFGWFGFNAGSSLAADGLAVNAFVVTNTAAAAALLTWVIISWVQTKKASVTGAATGAVAGLVAITPAAGFVGAMPALIIGIGAGVICYIAIVVLAKLKIDDALAVFGVHGMGGIWGAVATGLFVGWGYGALGDDVTRMAQVNIQLIAIGATIAYSFVVTAIILLVIKFTLKLEVSEEDERSGLDVSQHGEEAYMA